MNNTPPPVDISKLGNILGKAKNIMNNEKKINPVVDRNKPLPPPSAAYEDSYVETRVPISGNQSQGMIDDNIEYLTEAEVLARRGHTPMPINHSMTKSAQLNPAQLNPEVINNSKLPEAIKNMYLNNSTHQPNTSQTFNTDNSLNEEYVGEKMITISESALKGMIKDVLVEYLTVDYSKNLTETAIKKTINTLIKEGKIKTRSKR